jgi:hypothetical protein
MRIKTLIATAGLLLSATAALAQNITYDFDKAMDFGRLRTYAQRQRKQPPFNHLCITSPAGQRLVVVVVRVRRGGGGR